MTWFSPGRARRRRTETDGDDDHTEELTNAVGSGDESEADDATDSDGSENSARASSARGIVPAVPRWNGAWSWLDAEDMFEGIIANGRHDDDVDDAASYSWDDSLYGADDELEDDVPEMKEVVGSRREQFLRRMREPIDHARTAGVCGTRASSLSLMRNDSHCLKPRSRQRRCSSAHAVDSPAAATARSGSG